MAKLKYLKLPKKPRAGASVAQLENWLKKVDAVKKENTARKRDNDRQESLRKRVAGIGSAHVMPGSRSVSAHRPKRRTAKKTTRKKAARKKSTRRRRR